MRLSAVSLFCGLSFTIPLTIWALGQISGHPDTPLANGFTNVGRDAAYATLISQAVALAIFTPWVGRLTGWRCGFATALLLNLVSLPLYVLFWLSGAIDVIMIAHLYGLALVTTLILLLLSRSMIRLLRINTLSGIAIGGLQVVAVLGAITFSAEWTAWLGLN